MKIETRWPCRDMSLVHIITCEDLDVLAAMFCRVQEFYESANPDFNRRYFTQEDFQTWYIGQHGSWSYATDWCGFNVPGEVILAFTDLFHDLSPHEHRLITTLKEHTPSPDSPWYVIGIVAGDSKTLRHEYAHALYALCDHYRLAVDALLGELQAKAPELFLAVVDYLRQCGYHDRVLLDELHVHLFLEQRQLKKDGKIPYTYQLRQTRDSLRALFDKHLGPFPV